MKQVFDLAKSDHRKIRYAPSKVSLEPLVCPGVGNLNNIPTDMALSGRDGKNLLSAALSDAAVLLVERILLVVLIFRGVYMK